MAEALGRFTLQLKTEYSIMGVGSMWNAAGADAPPAYYCVSLPRHRPASNTKGEQSARCLA